jgi:sugar-specific transcriptional regulator TrmB
MIRGDPIDALTALGLTRLEAAAYAHLLRESAQTGYRVALGIGKPTANTYKALAALEEKGAVVAEGAARRVYRAVPPDELLNALERRFLDHRQSAAAGLAALRVPGDDARIYHLRSADQVVERLRAMLSGCRWLAVLDLAPWVVGRVAGEMEFAAGTGARVMVKTYEPVAIAGVEVVAAHEPPTDGPLPINAVVDGREMVLASGPAGEPRVHRALWSANGDMAWMVHGAIVAELLFTAVERGLEDGLSTDELEDTFEMYRSLRARPTE